MIPVAPALLAQLPAQPEVSEILEFQATGLVVVFGALAVLWLLLEITGAIFRRRSDIIASRAPAPTPIAEQVDSDDLPDGVVAAIAAAVHITFRGQPHQITSIKASRDNPHWAAEGRREIFSSHRVR